MPSGRARRLVRPVFAALMLAVVLTPAIDARLVRAATGAERSSSGAVAASAGDYEVLRPDGSGRPDQWPACRPILYRVNPKDEPAGLGAVVRTTMATLGAQLGVRFTNGGPTTRSFGSLAHPGTPTITIGFTRAASAAGVRLGWPGTIGLGGPIAEWWPSTGVERITAGRVLLSTRFSGPLYGRGQTWQALLTHEIGHTLNLAHRSSPRDAMAPALTPTSPTRFAAGEVRALKAVLRTSGC